ncbi:Uncharacterized protein APZ42_022085 [Daphnia magna]|uniref:Uncharacterized protein n=1 Tax=Daphnia magna TaxID=35525 RepID=A0A164VZU9_9CRUS|nr:Uncharacterized protein APZ42_022085 [Daphnia magna]
MSLCRCLFFRGEGEKGRPGQDETMSAAALPGLPTFVHCIRSLILLYDGAGNNTFRRIHEITTSSFPIEIL